MASSKAQLTPLTLLCLALCAHAARNTPLDAAKPALQALDTSAGKPAAPATAEGVEIDAGSQGGHGHASSHNSGGWQAQAQAHGAQSGRYGDHVDDAHKGYGQGGHGHGSGWSSHLHHNQVGYGYGHGGYRHGSDWNSQAKASLGAYGHGYNHDGYGHGSDWNSPVERTQGVYGNGYNHGDYGHGSLWKSQAKETYVGYGGGYGQNGGYGYNGYGYGSYYKDDGALWQSKDNFAHKETLGDTVYRGGHGDHHGDHP